MFYKITDWVHELIPSSVHVLQHAVSNWPTCTQVFFQGFLLGPFLQRRLSLAEQLGVWGGFLPPPPPYREAETCAYFSVVEMQCVKAVALRDTINWLKMANALFFLCCEMISSHFLLNLRVFNWKLICTRDVTQASYSPEYITQQIS